MLFHSQTFILAFLPLCLGGFFLCGRYLGPPWALRFLTAASLVFYGWWDPRYVPLLIASIVINHGLTRAIRAAHAVSPHQAAMTPDTIWRPSAKWILTAGITLNLAVLGLFKYSDFVLVSLQLAPIGLSLPLAISFFTFQQIMYLIDTYKDPRQTVPLLHAAAFVTFFPHLIAGPIVRPMEIIPQLASSRCARPDTSNLTAGLSIFLLGLSKKLVLADLFGGFADTGFNAAAHGETLTFLEAWYATLSYSLQIYFDFSGYSDMAIGLARMLNVRFPLNFDSPYQARDIAAFWRRWHMTLGLFLRDYVYLPLGGNRRRHTVNLLITMLLCGLWHGAAWQFVLWEPCTDCS